MTAATAIREVLPYSAHMLASLSPATFDMTARRWSNAIANNAFPLIGFDKSGNYAARSAECLTSAFDAQLHVDISCDVRALLSALPPRLHPLVQGRTDECLTGVTDICLGLGNLPVIVVNGEHQKLVDGSNYPRVTRTGLNSIIHELDRSTATMSDYRFTTNALHRCSVVYAATKDEGISAITLCVGRVVRNQALMLSDLLFSSENLKKSVLVIGLPASGKTTLLRDIARCVSEEHDGTYIVDTWNELGGTKADAREYLGSGSRLMVRSRDE